MLYTMDHYVLIMHVRTSLPRTLESYIWYHVPHDDEVPMLRALVLHGLVVQYSWLKHHVCDAGNGYGV